MQKINGLKMFDKLTSLNNLFSYNFINFIPDILG